MANRASCRYHTMPLMAQTSNLLIYQSASVMRQKLSAKRLVAVQTYPHRRGRDGFSAQVVQLTCSALEMNDGRIYPILNEIKTKGMQCLDRLMRCQRIYMKTTH